MPYGAVQPVAYYPPYGMNPYGMNPYGMNPYGYGYNYGMMVPPMGQAPWYWGAGR
jgi:hypothetical protein